MKRRDEKLCFQCGGPFGTGPRFPEKSLRAVILVEDELINEDGEITRKKTETGTEEDDNEAVDLILGVAWLATLGEVKVNWKSQTMKFVQQGQVVEVKGDPGYLED